MPSCWRTRMRHCGGIEPSNQLLRSSNNSSVGWQSSGCSCTLIVAFPPAEPRCACTGEARRALRARASRKNRRNSLSGREAAFAPGAQAVRCLRKFIYERLRLLPSDSVALLPQSSAIQLSGKSQTFALRTVLTWTSALRRRPTPSRWVIDPTFQWSWPVVLFAFLTEPHRAPT